MDRGTLVRRGFHLASPVWLIWYWMPPDAWIGVPKAGVLLFFLCGALLIEAARLIGGFRLSGLRDYERDRISGYAWGSLGLALGLLFFPGQIVIVTFWGMAWIDPVCRYAKARGLHPWVPLVTYLALAVVLWVFVVPLAVYQTTPISPAQMAVYAPLAAVLAIAAEKPNLRWVDDDFLMHVVPMLALALVSAVL